MSVRKELILIAILLAIVIVLLSISPFFKADVEEADAKRFVEEDLNQKYPQDDTEILTVLEKKDETGQKYFEVKARVTKNRDGICPERRHTYYYYPKQNFVTPPDEVVTTECTICTGTSACILVFEEEAVVGSHTLPGTEEVARFIANGDVKHRVSETPQSWIVEWANEDNEGYRVEIARSGTVRSVKKNEL